MTKKNTDPKDSVVFIVAGIVVALFILCVIIGTILYTKNKKSKSSGSSSSGSSSSGSSSSGSSSSGSSSSGSSSSGSSSSSSSGSSSYGSSSSYEDGSSSGSSYGSSSSYEDGSSSGSSYEDGSSSGSSYEDGSSGSSYDGGSGYEDGSSSGSSYENGSSGSSYDSGSSSISGEIILTSDKSSICSGDSITLTATILYSNGYLYNNRVLFYINDTLSQSVVADDGIATYTVKLPNSDAYNIVAKTDKLESNNLTITPYACVESIEISADSTDVCENTDVKFTASFTTSGGDNSSDIYLYINDQNVGKFEKLYYQTRYTLKYKFETAGVYTVFAKMEDSVSNRIDITVSTCVNSISLSADSTSVSANDTVTLTATTSTTGSAYNGDIEFYINDELISTVTATDNEASASVSFTDEGTYEAYAKAGDYTSGTIEIVVGSTVESIRMSYSKKRSGGVFLGAYNIYAYITTHNDSEYNGTVTFYVDNEKYAEVTASKSTASTVLEVVGTMTVYAVADDVKSDEITLTE